MEELRVLLVDDEIELVSALEERLNLRGIQATGVTSGQDALDYLADNACDVVLLDVKMPGLGGLEIMKQLQETRPELQVILLTGHSSRQDADRGMEAGAFEYLMKPVKIDELVQALLRASAAGGT